MYFFISHFFLCTMSAWLHLALKRCFTFLFRYLLCMLFFKSYPKKKNCMHTILSRNFMIRKLSKKLLTTTKRCFDSRILLIKCDKNDNILSFLPPVKIVKTKNAMSIIFVTSYICLGPFWSAYGSGLYVKSTQYGACYGPNQPSPNMFGPVIRETGRTLPIPSPWARTVIGRNGKYL